MPLGYWHCDRRGFLGPWGELSTLGLNSDPEVELRVLQLPVDYREVKRRVTRIWEDLQPQLVVHVGLDASAKAIVLEQCAKNRGYWDADIRGFRPARGECLPDGPEVIASGVNMRAVRKRVAVEGVQVIYSRDAGRYICDYTYYLSLHHGNGRAALIHVPPLSCRLPAPVLGEALRVLTQDMLAQMGRPSPKPGSQEAQPLVIPAQGNRLGDCSFREN
ncbi:LOW QUALITY PROTEIN: pyroglutamyl-peptidase 1-like protein [Hyaena hyaena]|uniref:LOW QUALITY PROTEIN: pyroglutamyl-peptidase 1-like protein n=1 Tax=Hyaena hyaena TaxID=95912 RepID=UPI0019250C8F|nr:LOW QUALITY PROTEIN: pyroglutamyl-peptidase 1-like protein [Hyaena hyaena]